LTAIASAFLLIIKTRDRASQENADRASEGNADWFLQRMPIALPSQGMANRFLKGMLIALNFPSKPIAFLNYPEKTRSRLNSPSKPIAFLNYPEKR
jgi:hypothetical protein